MSARVSALVSVVGLLAACASVPTGGRVTGGRPAERTEPFDDPYVRIVPVPPGRDWQPSDIVNGFLSASASFDDGHGVAREYLLREVRWWPEPWPSVTVYENGSLEVILSRTEDGQATVQVTGNQLGIIRFDGQYEAEPRSVNETFHLAKGPQNQWRISQLPTSLTSGLLLSQRDVDRAFRTMNLYFFAPDGQVLVPNAIFLPLGNRQDLPSQIVRALLKGPTVWLRSAVRNSFPPGTRLLGDGVRVTDGVATVNLSREAARGNIAGMSAQLMWTLRQLAEVKYLKLEIDGKARSPGGVGPTQSPEDWRANNPDGATGGSPQQAYLQGPGGRLDQLFADRPTPVATLENGTLSDPSISLDRRVIAGLGEARDRVVMGELAISGGPTRLRTVISARHRGGTFTSPSWDRHGTMWTVESAGGRSWLWIKLSGKPPVRVADTGWGLSGYNVRELRIAQDGVRAAAIVVDGERRAQIRIGRIERNGSTVTAGEFLPISSELVDVAHLAWQDADELAVLGRLQRTTAQMLPYRVPVSGGKIGGIGFGAPGEIGSISAAPNAPVLVSAKVPGKDSENDRVCRLTDPQDRLSEWDCFVAGHDPFYPG
ncbi:GerMN domain-containing protein [Actinomadura alba]|uniref:GerMN domain-containing protein n=2 Tax=Actinomadura alba TaxID=406431 RepID=A0ABR7LJ99_9ACTN|nr:GerMN domain-containing protein [Actinomadura alba]